ncbi:MAG: TRAP transporter small permease [Deltaproteobacteria bacterium]|nr:TRAP transporter small permease [Deltaproteobacteria bacterium]
MLKKVDRFFHSLGLIEMWFSAILLLGIVSIILLQVFCRYVLGSPLIWPEELAILISLWMTFIGASYVFKKNRHLLLSFFVDRLPKPAILALDLLTNAAILLFFYYLFVGGLKIIPIQARNLTPALRIPTHYYTVPVLITAFLISLFIFSYFLRRIIEAFKSEENEGAI